MAEHSFLEVVRQWNRMCESRSKICQDAYGKCLLYHYNHQSDKYACNKLSINEATNIEHVIMDWAEKHPEPIYPTFREWLMSITHDIVNDKLLDSPITADMAQKLGVKPIE